ncbi:hypothetical protein [Collimonas pratensis]|uniref:hypothetical protein n=1 Tax=Collimonas pratensis TaxID=279113 RepID=UPI00143DAF6C|nr:hypothetical protein [Collimonas pratensis]
MVEVTSSACINERPLQNDSSMIAFAVFDESSANRDASVMLPHSAAYRQIAAQSFTGIKLLQKQTACQTTATGFLCIRPILDAHHDAPPGAIPA